MDGEEKHKRKVRIRAKFLPVPRIELLFLWPSLHWPNCPYSCYSETVTGKKCTKWDINALEAAFTFSFRTVAAQPEEDIRAPRMEFTIVFCRTSIFRTFCLVGYYTMSNVPYRVSCNDLPNWTNHFQKTSEAIWYWQLFVLLQCGNVSQTMFRGTLMLREVVSNVTERICYIAA
jgi:hypothetical protein